MRVARSEPDSPPIGRQDPAGRWENDGGTVIDVDCHGDGRLSGTIRFASDGTAYKPYHLKGTWITRPDGRSGMVGTLPGWPRPSSVTVWCGDLDPDGTTLTTDFLMAVGSPPSMDWETATGGTIFHRAAGRPRSA